MLRVPNRAMWWVVGRASLTLAAVLYVPFLRDLLRFSYLHWTDLLICLTAGMSSIAWFEIYKKLTR